MRLDYGWIAGTNSNSSKICHPWLWLGHCCKLISYLSEKWRSNRSQKLLLAQHGLLGTPGSGAAASVVASHSPAFCWKTWGFRVCRDRNSVIPSPFHSSISPELWKLAGTIFWASYRRCCTAFVKMSKICHTESCAPMSFWSVGQGATGVENWLNITF